MSDETLCGDYPAPCNCDDPTTHDRPVISLVARLVQQNYNDYVATSQVLIDNLTEQLAEAEAELAIIRATIEDLAACPWVPSMETVRRALWPSAEQIKAHRVPPER